MVPKEEKIGTHKSKQNKNSNLRAKQRQELLEAERRKKKVREQTRVSNDCEKNVEKKIEKTEAKMKAHVWVHPPSKTGWQKPSPAKNGGSPPTNTSEKSGNF